MTWSDDLDMLARANVIGFDAPSYITGRQPRYIGNPVAPAPYPVGAFVEQPFLPGQPKIDEFKSSQNTFAPPDWKKWLFGAIAIVGTAFAFSKFRNGIIPFFRNFGPNIRNLGTRCRNLFRRNP